MVNYRYCSQPRCCSFVRIQTHKRFKRKLFIKTRTQPPNFRGSPVYRATKRHLNNSLTLKKRWKMRRKARPFICFWLSDVVFLSSSLESFNAKLSPGRCWRQTLFFFSFSFSGSVHTLFHELSGVRYVTILLAQNWQEATSRRLQACTTKRTKGQQWHHFCNRAAGTEAPQNGQENNKWGTTKRTRGQQMRHHKTDKRTTNEAPQSGEGWWRLPEYKHSIISAAFPIPSPCFWLRRHRESAVSLAWRPQTRLRPLLHHTPSVQLDFLAAHYGKLLLIRFLSFTLR